MVVVLKVDKNNPERRPSMFLMESQSGRDVCLVSWVVPGPLQVSQEISVGSRA